MNFISDLVKRSTFISIVFILLAGLGIPLIVYQLFTLHSSAGLGITIEVIFLLVLFGLLIIDRFLLLNFNRKKLSVVEVIFTAGYLAYYYFTNDRSFSIG